MAENNTDLKSLATRVHSLEKQNRIWRIVIIAALIILLMFPLLWFIEEGQKLESKSYVLVDSQGKRRAVLGEDAAGSPNLVFYDKDGKILVLLSTKPDGSSSLGLYDKDGKVLFKAP
ncbi:hypothetical protein EHM69_01195 [candidate division KSB1 bacterium]|nr:MAG: hypothetical protein EHM69_01195 [candidate division KSB1 bacterium]